MTALIDLSDVELLGDLGGVHTDRSRDADRINRLLHPSSPARPIYENDLLAIADRIANSLELWRIAGRSLDGRQYRRILRTRSVEAWLIAWGPSTFLGLHDHGGSRSAFEVVAGLLAESSTSLVTRAPLATVQLRAGARRGLAARDVHELWNPSESPALSVHVYSSPLSSMNFFAHEKEQYLEKLRTETEWPDC